MDSARIDRPASLTRLRAVTEPAIVDEGGQSDRLDWLSGGHWQSTDPPRRPSFSFGLQILDRYIVKEMMGPFAFGFVATLSVTGLGYVVREDRRAVHRVAGSRGGAVPR